MLVWMTLNVDACGTGCTLSECVPRVDIYFKAPLIEAGHYTVILDAGSGQMITCTASVPYARDDKCTVDIASWIIKDPRSTSTNLLAAGPNAGLAGISVASQADSVSVYVSRGDLVLGEASIRPVWHQEEINGPGCGECAAALEHADFP
jgi:hypothetical protein